MDEAQLLEATKTLARVAGDAIMPVYRSGDFELEIKNEGGFISPLTQADNMANDIIVAGLRKLSAYPIISEEGSHDAGGSSSFWLVDPIDGTKEFLKHNGEFTVNIGLINDGKPLLGVVYAPAKRLMYFGTINSGAYKQQDSKEPVRIYAQFRGKVPTVVTSRSHINKETEAYLKKLGAHETIRMGSSLKLCLVAEGLAAIYPRLAPTSLWDTAAADAVLRASGGIVVDVHDQILVYDPARRLVNPHFIAKSKQGQTYQPSAENTAMI